MNHENNNINMGTRISSAFRTGRISKLIGTAAIGLALTIGVAMPSVARADLPSVTNPGSYLFESMNDDFSMVYGTPDTGLDLLGASTSAPAKVKTNTASIMMNDDFSMVYGIPDDLE
ncbi:MAG: hypothetical protein O2913_10865 [Chloroflexi bacterium]|nr:hypothetical protein [Chloroflexota bacterium]